MLHDAIWGLDVSTWWAELFILNSCVFQCVAFRDIAAQAPTHILVVPRKPIVRMSEAKDSDAAVSFIAHLNNRP